MSERLVDCLIDHDLQATYALGYNLAVEYMAAYEKTWLLESFIKIDNNFLKAQGREQEWMFLEVPCCKHRGACFSSLACG
jgi:hypothetical protein